MTTDTEQSMRLALETLGFAEVEHEYDNGETVAAWKLQTNKGFALVRDRRGLGLPKPDDWSVVVWLPAEQDDEPEVDIQNDDAHGPTPCWFETSLAWAKATVSV